MMYEVEPMMEHVHPVVVSWMDEDDYFSIGRKIYKQPGEFKYEWILEFITYEDLTSLIEALTFAKKQGRAKARQDGEK